RAASAPHPPSQYTPLPATMAGRSAAPRSAATRSTAAGSGAGRAPPPGARRTGERDIDRAPEVLRDEARLRHGPGALGDRAEERHLVHLLEGASTLEPERRAAAPPEPRSVARARRA